MRTDHKSDSEVFRAVLIEDARARAGEHPELDALVDYLADALDSDSNERIRDHLVACPDCATAVLDLETLMQPDAPAQDRVADLGIESAWRALEPRLADSLEAEMSKAGAGAHGGSRWPMALAASLLVATVGLSVWVSQLLESKADLSEQVAGLSAPQVNPPIVYLDGVTRSEPGARVVTFSPQQPFALLIAIPSAPELFSSYEAVLTDSADTVVWSGNGLELSEESTLRLWLPRVLLPEGDYEIRIRGLGVDPAAPPTEPVVATPLQVVYQ